MDAVRMIITNTIQKKATTSQLTAFTRFKNDNNNNKTSTITHVKYGHDMTCAARVPLHLTAFDKARGHDHEIKSPNLYKFFVFSTITVQ